MKRDVVLKKSGAGLVEVIVASAIITLIALSLISAYILHFRLGVGVVERVQAALLAEEGIEVAKFLRDDSWSGNIATLSTTSTYYLLATSSTWIATTTKMLSLSTFTRAMRVFSVNRDAEGNLVSSGGANDTGTRKVVVTVSYHSQSLAATTSLSTYLTNLFNN